jgi:hypothetical protein
VVVVRGEADADVEGFGSVDVGHRYGDEFEFPVHGEFLSRFLPHYEATRTVWVRI